MKQINKIINVLWKFNYIIEFILSLILAYSIFEIICFKNYFNLWNLKYIIICVIVLIPIIYIIYKNIKDNKKKIEKIFLAIAIPIVIGYTIFTLISNVPDEHFHIYRTYNIARGNIIIDIDQNEETIPEDFRKIEDIKTYKRLLELKDEGIDLNSEEIKHFNTFQIYFPYMYAGPAMVFKIAQLMNFNLINILYLMRVINAVMFLIFGYLAVKWIPFGKLLMMTYLCIPMIIHQAASISSDAFINAMCLAFIAFNMKLLCKKDSYTLAEKIIYFLLALGATLNKTAYLPLIFLGGLLIFNKENPRNKKDKIFVYTTTIVMIILSCAWYLYGTKYSDTREYIIENNINSSEQMKFIKSDPISFASTIVNTYEKNAANYLYQALGQKLGLLNIPINELVSISYLVMLILSVFMEKSEFKFKNWQKIYIILIVSIMVLLIAVALYLGWTVPGKNIIEGIQGRYFLPFAILVLLCFIPKNKYLKFKNTITIYSMFILLLNMISIGTIIDNFI